ncbi:MAG: hypothetical protein KAQ68_00835 [Clostridiales bacterium]|nr:hypothetical protein [Clostridiales bacterium]
MTNIKSKEENRRDFILNGNLYKIILKLSLPIMLSNLIQTVYSLTDTYFVSRIGDEYDHGEVIPDADGNWISGRTTILQDWILVLERM